MQDEAAGGPLLLAPSGVVLALRYELRPPFAAWLARQAQLLAAGAPLQTTYHQRCCPMRVHTYTSAPVYTVAPGPS